MESRRLYQLNTSPDIEMGKESSHTHLQDQYTGH